MDRRQKSWQAAVCLVCAAIAWQTGNPYQGTEFSGGTVTGPLLAIDYIGIFLFVVASCVAFVRPRVSAAIVLTASLLCLPFYLYFIAPGPFRSIFRGEYSVPAPASFVWHPGMVAGILALAVAVSLSLRAFGLGKRVAVRRSS
jgi:hypothetical protein